MGQEYSGVAWLRGSVALDMWAEMAVIWRLNWGWMIPLNMVASWCWFLVVGLSFLSYGFLSLTFLMRSGESKKSERERERETILITCHHFYYVLFIRSESLSPAHIQWRGNTSHCFNGTVSKNFWTYFETTNHALCHINLQCHPTVGHLTCPAPPLWTDLAMVTLGDMTQGRDLKSACMPSLALLCLCYHHENASVGM